MYIWRADKLEKLLVYLSVFIVGGILCTIAQILIDKTKITPARVLVSYVVGGVILTAMGIYGPIVDFAKAGATVPLTGFGYSLARGVEKAIDENGAIGILTGGFTATSAGIAAALVFAFVAALIFRSKPK